LTLVEVSTFSGIGGVSVACQWAGIEPIQFCEINPFCQSKLTKNFSGVPIHDDIRTFDGYRFRGRNILLTAGSPCQGFSVAGKRAGMLDPRSGLISEFFRVTYESQPAFVLIENSPNAFNLAGDDIKRGLAGVGYEILDSFSYEACLLGAKFKGERTFCISAPHDWCAAMRRDWVIQKDAAVERARSDHRRRAEKLSQRIGRQIEPRPYGVADGVPNRVDRITALGNAVSPIHVYPILQAIADLTNPPPQVDI
jgi:DNA (cytosine-5)-methyltransferase 1